MFIPLKKWIITESILKNFDTKCQQFLLEQEYRELADKIDYAGIIDIINDNDGEDLIEKLTKN